MFAKLFERDGQQVLVRKGELEGFPALCVYHDMGGLAVYATYIPAHEAKPLSMITECDAFSFARMMRLPPLNKILDAPEPFARLFEDDGGQIAVWLGDDEDYGELAIWIAWEDGEFTITTHASYRTEHHRKQDWQDITSAEAARAYAKKIGR